MPKSPAGNSFAHANDIGVLSGKQVYTGKLGSNDKVDFYTFKLEKSSHVNLALGRLKSNLDLELWSGDRTRLSHSRKKKNRRERIKAPLESGTYYIRVRRRRGTSSYRLKAIARTPASGDIDAGNPNTPPSIDPKSSTSDSVTKAERTALINDVLALTNAARAAADLSPLTLNSALTTAAQSQSASLALDDFFSHTSPEGTTLADRLDAANYSYKTAGENIAAGQVTATQVVQEWMASPGHRANILNPQFTELGVGYFFLEQDTGEVNYNRYWTQNFGAPTT